MTEASLMAGKAGSSVIPRTSDARIASLALLALAAHVVARMAFPGTPAASLLY